MNTIDRNDIYGGKKNEEVYYFILVNRKYKHDGIIDERYIESLLGESVVLFLQKGVFNQYYGAMQPFQFKLKNNHLAVMSNLTQVKEAFKKSISLNELISAIGKQGLSD